MTKSFKSLETAESADSLLCACQYMHGTIVVRSGDSWVAHITAGAGGKGAQGIPPDLHAGCQANNVHKTAGRRLLSTCYIFTGYQALWGTGRGQHGRLRVVSFGGCRPWNMRYQAFWAL